MSSSRRILAAGDVLALLLFTIVGLVSHEDGITAQAVLTVMTPILAVGALATVVFDTYRRPGMRTLLPAWAVSVPAGLLIRKTLFDTPSTWESFGVFVGVALTFTLLFLAAWRAVVWVLLRRWRARPSRVTC